MVNAGKNDWHKRQQFGDSENILYFHRPLGWHAIYGS